MLGRKFSRRHFKVLSKKIGFDNPNLHEVPNFIFYQEKLISLSSAEFARSMVSDKCFFFFYYYYYYLYMPLKLTPHLHAHM